MRERERERARDRERERMREKMRERETDREREREREQSTNYISNLYLGALIEKLLGLVKFIEGNVQVGDGRLDADSCLMMVLDLHFRERQKISWIC